MKIIKFIKKIWFKLRLFFAKRTIGIDYGNGYDKNCWVEIRFLDGKMYVTNSGTFQINAEREGE